LLAVYLAMRTRWGRLPSLLACLGISVNLSTFTYSRLAIAEPLGTHLSVAALALWVLGRRSGVLAQAGSLLLASAAFFVKISFVFTVIAVALLVLWDAV